MRFDACRSRTTTMNKRRALDRLRSSGRVIVRELLALCRRAARALSCTLLAAFPACTLLDEPFEQPIVGAADPDAPAAAEDGDDSQLSGNAMPGRCASEGAEGSNVNGATPSCASSVGLLDPAVGSESEPDADGLSEPSLSLPSCDGEYGPFGAPERLTGLEFDENVFGPSLSSDGRTLYFSAYVSGEQQIFSATRSTRSSDFDNVAKLPSAINSPGTEGTPFISRDGARLYLFSERQGGVGNRDIWVSRRQDGGFAEPELVANINSEQSDLLPWLSLDELTLVFVSNRSGGRGLADLWRASRASVDQAFDDPINLFNLSSSQNEGRLVLSADGLTAFFTSDRLGSRGGPDIWTASRDASNDAFSASINLAPLNTSADERDVVLSADETELFFASSRRRGISELWRAARGCD
jgi:Tol biopolymer transport system component